MILLAPRAASCPTTVASVPLIAGTLADGVAAGVETSAGAEGDADSSAGAEGDAGADAVTVTVAGATAPDGPSPPEQADRPVARAATRRMCVALSNLFTMGNDLMRSGWR
ncbi:hypothetical protein GCM10010517_24910 [Streptosporangium fragile]|uniref:Secreted protein n=1 Tax=Streptosporangium fragile TaxID=46186 RepID=A0ABP6IDP7_9ACTN